MYYVPFPSSLQAFIGKLTKGHFRQTQGQVNNRLAAIFVKSSAHILFHVLLLEQCYVNNRLHQIIKRKRNKLWYFSILFHGTSINIYTRLDGNNPRNKTTCVKTCGNLFTWKKVHYKYTVREWRQNVLQNLLPFGSSLNNRLLHLSLSLLTAGLQKVLLSRDKEREREIER